MIMFEMKLIFPGGVVKQAMPINIKLVGFFLMNKTRLESRRFCSGH